jgi:hypothetical protein
MSVSLSSALHGQLPTELISRLDALLFTQPDYNAGVQALTATGAINVTQRTTTLTVDGTVAFTLAAPAFVGQWKYIVMISGANTPIANITITGMRISTQDVWTMATFVAATAPRSLLLYSPDGLVWDPVATVGTVTVA